MAWPGVSAPMAVWREGTSLRGMPFAGSAPAGWPVAIDADAGQPAASPSTTEPEIFVPSAQGLLIVRYNGAAEPTTERLSFACSSVAVGELDGHGPVDVAAVDSFGALHIYLQRLRGEARHGGTMRRASNPLPPVITSGGVVLVACSDPSTPSTLQWLRRYRVDRGSRCRASRWTASRSTRPPSPRSRWRGFASDKRLVAVAADSAGGIHVIEPGTDPVVQFVSAGGPIAGEVLCADLDGDWESDLIALRRDGTLLAWRSDLTPLAGFPRRFPFGAIETPMVADAEGVRYVVVADTAGGLWSLPMGPAGRPAPWPTARGDAGRRAYLDFGRATPVEPGVNSLKWSGRTSAEFSAGRARGSIPTSNCGCATSTATTRSGRARPATRAACASTSVNAACTLAVDGLHRTERLARAALPRNRAPGAAGGRARAQPLPVRSAHRVERRGVEGARHHPRRARAGRARGGLLRAGRAPSSGTATTGEGARLRAGSTSRG